MKPYHYLNRLENIKFQFDSESTKKKITILRLLKNRRFNNAQHVRHFHEVLNFLTAFPDNKKIFNISSNLLAGFSGRSDLRKYKNKLINSGIAGTDIEYQFYWPMACWLAKNFPEELTIIWDELETADELMSTLPLLLPKSETGAMDELDLPPAEWINLLKGRRETDATFLINRFQQSFKNDNERETVHDKINLSYRFAATKNTPSIGNTKLPNKTIHYQTVPFDRKRPQLSSALKHEQFTSNLIDSKSGETYIDLARKTMLTHERDLDAFSYGNPADVRIIDFNDGHQLICNSLLPERRYLLHSTYGFLNLRNGIPIGYFQIINLYNNAETAFNLFPPFRGGETAKIFARNMAVAHQLFNVETFVMDPYQLGFDNNEGLMSGVWWFYYKLGFRPLKSNSIKLAKNELKKIASRSDYKTALSTLNTLASENMYFNTHGNYDYCNELENIGFIPLGSSRHLSKQNYTSREDAISTCVHEAMTLTNYRSDKKITEQQKTMWERWSPLLANIRGIKNWSASEKHKVGEIISARGKHNELHYVNLLNEHDKLKRGIIQYANRMACEI